MVRFTHRKQNSGQQGLGRERNGELLFDMYRISVWEDEKVLKMDDDDDDDDCTCEST